MMMNGPKIRLKSAPGRRTVSMTSLPRNEVVRVQLLSSPRNSSRIAFTLVLLLVCARLVGLRHQRGEDLVERRPVFAAGNDFDAQGAELLQHPRGGLAGIVADHQKAARRALAHAANTWHLLQSCSVERLRGFDLDNLATERLAAKLLGR